MNTLKTSVVAVLCAASLLGGCATMQDQQRTKTEGTVAGALIGGLLGYAIDGQRGAAVGALLGAGAGFVVGNEVAKRKQAYATTEEFLDAEIVRVEEFNATTLAYNDRLRREVATLDREAKTLRAQYDRGAVQKASLETSRANLQKRIEQSAKLEETLTQEYEVQTAILKDERQQRPQDDPHLARLEKEVLALQQNLDNLREGSTQLARIDQRLSI